MKDPAKAKEAVAILDSSDPENDGRRIERVPGGWIVLNARKYRDLVTREISKEKTRIRVARYRERNVAVRKSNPKVTHPNDSVTQSKADTETEAETKSETNTEASLRPVLPKREKKTVGGIGSRAKVCSMVSNYSARQYAPCGQLAGELGQSLR